LNAKVSATKVCPGCSARYPPDALFCPNDGSPLSSAPLTDRDSDADVPKGEGLDSYLGREISGHIEIQKLAGVGAMGRVYRAFQKGIDRDVAVKVLHRELSANQQLVARFHREAKVASRLQHPNVVQVHLAGQLPDGAMYIVMEYLDGLSLQSALAAAGGPLSVERALHIALQVCDAAGEAHSQGVVHRDIKPENVMLVRRGDDPDFVKVLDFGIARLNWGEQSMATAAGLIFGTARYISPEGAQGEAVGPAGDVYATATLLYQMLAGRTPFEGDQAVALLVQQIHDAPPPIRSIPAAAAVPEELAGVIMKNLSKSPADRAPNARIFGRALVEAAKSVGLTPEDLVPRSSLFVPPARLSDPGGSALATTLPASEAPGRPETVRDPVHLEPSAIPRPSLALPPSLSTQKWSPPSASPSAPRATPVPAATQYDALPPVAAQACGSSVDPTLDDSSPVRMPTPAPPPHVRTDPAMPVLANLALPTPTPGAPVAPPPAVPPVRSAMASLGEDEAAPSAGTARRRTGRLVGIVFLCLVTGLVGALVAAQRLGFVSGAPTAGSLDDVVARADDALKYSRWDAPPGDNVRDLTNDGLARFPGDRRLLSLRAHATDELVKEAVGRSFGGDLAAALHLARLAKELDPTDTTAQHLVEEYEHAAKSGGTEPSSTPASPIPTVTTPPHGSHPAPPASPHVVVDASLPHPKTGQPITFTAKVSAAQGNPRSVDDPRFVINGPGLSSDTKLGALPGPGGVYTATFTGFDPGKYDVTFDAKVDGMVVRATRSIVVEGPGGAPQPSSPPGTPSGTPSLPPPVPSGKWL